MSSETIQSITQTELQAAVVLIHSLDDQLEDALGLLHQAEEAEHDGGKYFEEGTAKLTDAINSIDDYLNPSDVDAANKAFDEAAADDLDQSDCDC